MDKFKDELGTEGGPLQELELLIASELSGVDEPIIRRAAAKLDFEFGPWRAGKDERREFAGKLLQADLERLPDALKELAKTSKFEDKAARNVIKHVLPFRISALAVAALPGIATRRPAEQRSVFLCAHAPRTGELCVRRAWCGVESWIVVTPDGVSGEDDVAAMVSKIWGIFKRKHLMDETKSLAEVKSWVERHLLKKRKEPLFIVLPEGVSAEVVAGVREEFKGFTVIILVGERATGDEIDLMNGAAHFLEPFREAADKGPPDEDPEQQVEDVYFELCSILGRRS